MPNLLSKFPVGCGVLDVKLVKNEVVSETLGEAVLTDGSLSLAACSAAAFFSLLASFCAKYSSWGKQVNDWWFSDSVSD